MIRCESFSSINRFNLCPLAYKLRYMDGKPQKRSEAAQRGSDIHAEISAKICKTPQAKFAKSHQKKFYMLDKNAAEYVQKEVELGIGFAEGFKPVDYEDATLMRGFVDLAIIKIPRKNAYTFFYGGLAQPEITIIDWKTGKNYGNRKQLKIYALWFCKKYNVQSVKCQFVYLDREKVNEFIFDDCVEIEDWLSEKISVIRAERDFCAKENKLCNWCDFEEICPAKKPLESMNKVPDLFRSITGV